MSRFEKSLSERDGDVLWHPYSQHGLNRPILPVVSGSGAYLKLSDGREILDAISSWWVNIHGHSHPRLVQAIQKQASQLEHVIFSGFTHEPAVELAELLTQQASIRKSGLRKVFYSDNGSTAVEVALKMAFQFYLNRGMEPRNRFLALSHSYHGDTLGAMAVGEPKGFHSQFRSLMPQVDFVDSNHWEQLEVRLAEHGKDYAAFIFEPLIQGAAGMKLISPRFLERAVQLCRKHGILVICDEIFTGFYRTGKCFAFEHMNLVPDLLCVSKGITGGFLPLAATLTSEEVYEAFLSKEIRTAFLHGHSYTANPIACAVAVESWKLLHTSECQQRIQDIVEITEKRISRFKEDPNLFSKLKDARCLGTIGAIELKNDQNYFSSHAINWMDLAIEKNVLLRPLGNVLYTVPPYCVNSEEIHRIYDVMEALLS